LTRDRKLKTVRSSNGHRRSLRFSGCASLAALLILLGSQSLQNATANGDTRSLTLRHTHTNEKLTITFKVNGRYDDEALKKVNHVLRDWREDQAISMDPHLLDLIWDVYREVEATEPIAVVCGYRSPGTNAMLRRRSSGVAQFSQHMLGKAIDFNIDGVAIEDLRVAGLRLQRGGVGFYPSSGSPFVHMDTGGVRHWPRMAPDMLARVLSTSNATRLASAERRRMPTPSADDDETETVRPVASRKPAPETKPATKPVVVATAPNAQQAFALASASSTPFTLGSSPRRAAPKPAGLSERGCECRRRDIGQYACDELQHAVQRTKQTRGRGLRRCYCPPEGRVP